MAKKETEAFTNTEQDGGRTAPREADTTFRRKKEHNSSGFWCYIGPSIKGVICHGTVYRGTREEALAQAGAAIERDSTVRSLIVSGDGLAEARVRAKTPGTALYKFCRDLSGR